MLTNLKEKINPSHTALIVVDMQNDFCANGGILDSEVDIKLIQAMVPGLMKFIDKARKVGLPIIYIQSIYHTKDSRYLSNIWLEQHKRHERGCYCERGSWGADFCNGIKPLPEEVIINKHRYSAFIDTDLDLILRSKQVKTLVMTGVTTNVCVESTCRDGFKKDYYIILLKDCTATYSEEVHNDTLKNIDLFFGEVVDSHDVLECWNK